MKLILVAMEEELREGDLPGYEIHYTGVGKVNAAISATRLIKEYSPSLIINYGTAGSLNKNLQGLVEVKRFCQRDMNATPLGFEVGQTPFDDIGEINLGGDGCSCGTGDSFVTKNPELKTDVVDMEAYSIAKVCYIEDVSFRCFKFISDNADSNADVDWSDNVSLGREIFINSINKLNLC
ncbi:5'-methylthioadenosine/S-adenosylhomocysteine nucleosidase [Planktomarina temperata]|nr:5'-methylthioadenosine/S-adenosylhomocysteine nucleosidase [Planktomarina temperata]